MAAEQADESLLKLPVRCIDCAAVFCVGYCPQGDRWVSQRDLAGMADGDVAVVHSMDEQNRYSYSADRRFW